MKLRTRLVLALVLLATLGLAAFGVATYSLYQRSLIQQLDEQLAGFARPQGVRLAAQVAAGTATPTCVTTSPDGGIPQPGGGDGRGGFAPGQGADAYSALYVDGALVACEQPVTFAGRPAVPTELVQVADVGYATVGSAEGSGRWRVRSQATATIERPGGRRARNAGDVVVVAVPMSGLHESLRRLVRIELVAGAFLIAALALGAWLILRRGLRPLEEMAESAATITGGDLSGRVEPANTGTEVGQLGLALNTMLDGIEEAFHEREATERRLRQFLADASHELRTPLTSIQGFAELFRLGGDHDLDLPVIMRRIEQESGRMRTLVEDLFLLAELDETRPVAADPVDLTVLAADVCTDVKATAPDRQVTLDGPGPAVVRGDADHLRQAIANLMGNAVRHTPAGSPIEVRTRREGGLASVSVRDHGPGLDERAITHVFDRFWQADAARVGSGAGLGLSIVAGIAEEHQGTVTAANAEGGGAVFTITLASG